MDEQKPVLDYQTPPPQRRMPLWLEILLAIGLLGLIVLMIYPKHF